MGEVCALATYPLTGARGVEHGGTLMGPAGIVGDHLYVAYDPTNLERVSQKQVNEFAQIDATYNGDALCLHHETAGSLTLPYIGGPATLSVVEFTDPTPCIDAGDEAEAFLSEVAHRHLRLAQKGQDWTNGHGLSTLKRANAPLHIINSDTLAALQAMNPELDFGANRFRANMQVNGFGAFEENTWVGHLLRIGDTIIRVTRLTPRCPVPGRDPQTGKNLKDVPTLYPRLPKILGPDGKLGKPAFGVYAVPIFDDKSRHQRRTIAVTDKVELLTI
ncbi:MAG TPA: MOSC domain-containing protein [Bacillota bacterium]|nr:MOSC domain-containing protein [Bacillota bacterium]